ncbi:MAG: YebC/PmpR family DNA-binding transcriptional regulator [Bacteroidetes bacterium]|nr:MAG: YebC/PmpR family DNA-binding transcriptional regulator [Bacteroidota bacterium]RLD70228.1 MAG: YebC/PmpR family DNA-binding transcriptional regulator [Bacteroidota bacterium]RLD91354.1 MAG: YebC/PmpR family DNA-binding transcriptional regulator [Bacteroidota bacterium]
MSGHSKWSTIKRKKGANDARRGKLFTKLIKEITVAASVGGTDEESNPRLRSAVQNARGMNMPKDTIQRAINKADRDNSSFLELSFEGKLPHGVLVFVDSLTDNRNRTVSNVRAIFTKRGGELGTNGSLSYMFDRKGIISLPKGELDPDEFELELIDAGVEEIELEDDIFMITTPMEDFHSVQLKLQEMSVEPESAELQRIPNDTLDLTLEQGVQIMKIIEEFEDDDDVQSVYHNVNVSDELAEAME